MATTAKLVPGGGPEPESYGLAVAAEAHAWYDRNANRARIGFRVSEVALLVTAAAIPASAAVWSDEVIAPAVLGAAVVVLTGMRSIFHWQDNYLRFSGARQAIETERRLYHAEVAPYDDASTRDGKLVAAVSRIEQEETAGWLRVAAERPKP